MAAKTQTATLDETQAADTSSATKPRVIASKNVFDRAKKFSGFVPHPDFPDGRKPYTVRFPTDKEWCQRAHKSVSVRKSTLDGTRTEQPGLMAADKDLLDQILVGNDETVTFDEAEASRIISKLERMELVETTRNGVQYTIQFKAMGLYTVTHTLKIPTQKQVMDLGRAAVDIVGRKQAVETRVALEPSGALWRKIVIGNGWDGYSDAQIDTVPVIHMDFALNELLGRINQDFEDTDPEG